MSDLGNAGTDIVARALANAAGIAATTALEDGPMHLTVGGTVDAITAPFPVGVTALADMQAYCFESTGANTGPVTLNIGGTGAKPIVMIGGAALAAGDIPAATTLVEVFYTATGDHYMAQLIRQPSAATPATATAAGIVGTSTKFARGDHAHPSQVLDFASNETGVMATGVNTIPFDNTLPQVTEGDQYLSLIYTPKKIGATCYIDIEMFLASSAGQQMCVALFKDGAANAVAVGAETLSAANVAQMVRCRYKFVVSSLAAITFTVRAGGNNAGTTTFNGVNGVQAYGGAMSSGIYLQEVMPGA